MEFKKFNLNESGLQRFFGPLESKIMEFLWSHPEQTIKEVQTELEKEKKISFNTVMTVMNRLVEKNLLIKQQTGRKTLYQATISRAEFLQKQSKTLTHQILDEFGPITVSYMLDEIQEIDASLLEKLEAKVKQLKKDKN